MRVARQNLLERGLQGGGFGCIAVKDLVVDRHALSRLYHTEHELAGDDPFLGHAEVAHVAVLLGVALGADGSEVVEHHREVFVDERAQQLGHAVVNGILVIYQRIHAAQQVLVSELVHLNARHAHGLQPTQHAQFGLGITQPIEDHHANCVLDRRGEALATKDGAQAIESELMPKSIQCPDIAQREC